MGRILPISVSSACGLTRQPLGYQYTTWHINPDCHHFVYCPQHQLFIIVMNEHYSHIDVIIHNVTPSHSPCQTYAMGALLAKWVAILPNFLGRPNRWPCLQYRLLFIIGDDMPCIYLYYYFFT